MSLGLGETEPGEIRGGEPGSAPAVAPGHVTFERRELRRILGLYGRKVAAGEWRDYAIDFLKDRAVFSVFRRSSEVPIYRIEKNPRLARRQGIYSIVSATGLILKRGHELDRVLYRACIDLRGLVDEPPEPIPTDVVASPAVEAELLTEEATGEPE